MDLVSLHPFPNLLFKILNKTEGKSALQLRKTCRFLDEFIGKYNSLLGNQIPVGLLILRGCFRPGATDWRDRVCFYEVHADPQIHIAIAEEKLPHSFNPDDFQGVRFAAVWPPQKLDAWLAEFLQSMEGKRISCVSVDLSTDNQELWSPTIRVFRPSKLKILEINAEDVTNDLLCHPSFQLVETIEYLSAFGNLDFSLFHSALRCLIVRGWTINSKEALETLLSKTLALMVSKNLEALHFKECNTYGGLAEDFGDRTVWIEQKRGKCILYAFVNREYPDFYLKSMSEDRLEELEAFRRQAEEDIFQRRKDIFGTEDFFSWGDDDAMIVEV